MPKKPKSTASTAHCASCGAELPVDAAYCPACGARTEGKTAARWTWLKVAVPATAMIVVIGGLAFISFGPGSGTPVRPVDLPNFTVPVGPMDAPLASRQPSAPQPPDLSTMTPREAADRLFNRVMTASERGNRDEAQRFAPMALEAYAMIEPLDPDGLFHVGLINLVRGDLDQVRAQAEGLEAAVKDHLLGLSLAHEVELRSGRADEATAILSRFSAAYEAEIAIPREEYLAHRNTIERTKALAAAGIDLKPAPKPVDPGEALFSANCAICHGVGAKGTSKGPPLVHKYYEPSHHGDDAIYRAVARGVKQHHWGFGDMPPVPGVARDDVTMIIGYVRGLQRAAGIF